MLSLHVQPQSKKPDEISNLSQLNMGRSLWSHGVPEMKRRVFEFSSVLRSNSPKLARHAQSLGISLDFLVSQWFGTLFGYLLPEILFQKALDVSITLGWPGMMTLGNL